MNHIGRRIYKIFTVLAVVIVVFGFILGCAAGKEAVYLYIADFEDFVVWISAFFTVFSAYLGIGGGAYCFGVLFGYLDNICDLLGKKSE